MKKVFLIYDNTIPVSDRIKTIIGNKSFGDIVIKGTTEYSKIEYAVNSVNNNIKTIRVDKINAFNIIESLPNDGIYMHLFSNNAVINMEEFKNLLQKLEFVKESIKITNSRTIGYIFKDKESYSDFLNEYIKTDFLSFKADNQIETEMFTDLTGYNNIIKYLTKEFDTRYFNTLTGDQYIVTKKSKDKNKMMMEYNYYWLLPDSMKSWMVMPYDYMETDDYAQYKMERMPMTDLAIRWTHEAIDLTEFNEIMDKIFFFFKQRKEKKVTKEESEEMAEKLYIEKLHKRISILKTLPEYVQIDKMIKCGTEYNSIDAIIEEYIKIYRAVTKKHYNMLLMNKAVIGHGDVFFRKYTI